MYTLLNAVLRNKQHPRTFHIPSEKETLSLKAGDYAKVCFMEAEHSERMWVRIVERNHEQFFGVLENEPFHLQSVEYGDWIEFKREHILAILMANGF